MLHFLDLGKGCVQLDCVTRFYKWSEGETEFVFDDGTRWRVAKRYEDVVATIEQLLSDQPMPQEPPAEPVEVIADEAQPAEFQPLEDELERDNQEQDSAAVVPLDAEPEQEPGWDFGKFVAETGEKIPGAEE